MIREDYILRMIEQVGELVRRLLNRGISRKEFDSDLDKHTLEWIGLPSELLFSIPVNHVYGLFQDSDRMVVEKSYIMAEIFRAKGMAAGSDSTRFEHFDKALFLYRKWSGLVDPKLQSEIDERVGELTAKLEDRPDDAPPLVEDDDSWPPPPPPVFHSPKSRANRQTKRAGTKFWYAVAACFVACAVYILLSQNDIEIADRNWSFENGLARAEFRIINHTDKTRLVRLELSVEHNSKGTFGSDYIFLGSVEREYVIAPNSSETFEEEFEYSSRSSKANQSITFLIRSSQAIKEGALPDSG